MSWKDALDARQEIVLATTSKKGKPRAIVVMSLGFVGDKLLIGACQMRTTLKNIKKTKKVSIVTKYKRKYYRVNGTTAIHSFGKYFDAAIERSGPPLPKLAITIDIKEVFDLNKVKKVNLQ